MAFLSASYRTIVPCLRGKYSKALQKLWNQAMLLQCFFSPRQCFGISLKINKFRKHKEKVRRHKRKMGTRVTLSSMGFQNHSSPINRRNPLLLNIRYIGHHPIGGWPTNFKIDSIKVSRNKTALKKDLDFVESRKETTLLHLTNYHNALSK